MLIADSRHSKVVVRLAVLVTVVSDLFTIWQSEVNSHHVNKDPWVVLTSDCEIQAAS